MNVPEWAWLAFAATVVVLLAVDITVHWRAEHLSRRSAGIWTAVWIGAGLAFGGAVWGVFGADAAGQYLGAYAMEKSLSLDNLFLFLLVFSSLGISEDRQRFALYLGIFAAVVLRGLFIWLGLELVHRLAWVEWVFGAILLAAAVHAAREHPGEQSESKVVAWLARHLPLAKEDHGTKLLARENGKRVVTPLCVAILAIELADVAFAVDSVPAALSISKEPFIVYSSNVFAILGLRSLYALLASTVGQLRYLHWGIAAVLAFAAIKMLGDRWFHVPPVWSVLIIALLIGIATIASLRADRHEAEAPAR